MNSTKAKQKESEIANQLHSSPVLTMDKNGLKMKSPTKKEIEFRKKLWDFFKDYQIDLSNYKFNREELYDRP